MTYNIITFGKKKENLKLAIENSIIGSYQSTFKEYMKSDSKIFLHCNSQIWGEARVSSDYFYDEAWLWEDKQYPHRFRIDDIRLVSKPVVLTNGVYNTEFRENFGTSWAYKFIFSPKPLPETIAKKIETELSNQHMVTKDSFIQNY